MSCRVTPEVRRALQTRADKAGMTLSRLAGEVLAAATELRLPDGRLTGGTRITIERRVFHDFD